MGLDFEKVKDDDDDDKWWMLKNMGHKSWAILKELVVCSNATHNFHSR